MPFGRESHHSTIKISKKAIICGPAEINAALADALKRFDIGGITFSEVSEQLAVELQKAPDYCIFVFTGNSKLEAKMIRVVDRNVSERTKKIHIAAEGSRRVDPPPRAPTQFLRVTNPAAEADAIVGRIVGAAASK